MSGKIRNVGFIFLGLFTNLLQTNTTSSFSIDLPNYGFILERGIVNWHTEEAW
jgi:hypothetical protein